ncbi:MAG: ammonium transporter [Microscillaceae bacterium]|jgi:Amt family ammonium transporter|nr:ammonium transporter [Microscillaceae bacterium]
MEQALFTTHNLWMMISTALVFIMHLGFASLESGLTRSKNTTNVLFKNTLTPGLGLLMYALVGFGLMYPGFKAGESMDFFGFAGFGLNVPAGGESVKYNPGYTYWTDFLFQGMFAATCATIVSGAVAERIKLMAFMLFSTVFVALVYPIIGSWKWGYGWLNTVGFWDFAGSTLVHSVGGWAALAGILLLGARIGKYEGKKVNTIAGHSMPMAVLGTFMLWLGWFGFNGGSVLSADPGAVSRVLVMTSMAAAAGGIAATFAIYFATKKYDLGMVLNGILAGLVGITAGADQMGVTDSVLIGAISGVLVVFAVMAFDKIRIDDPVGALSVHLVCGIFGTLAVGLFGAKAGMNQFLIQLMGVLACGITAFSSAFIIFFVLKMTMGIRVSAEEEINGLDYHEHGMNAYELHHSAIASMPVSSNGHAKAETLETV